MVCSYGSSFSFNVNIHVVGITASLGFQIKSGGLCAVYDQ